MFTGIIEEIGAVAGITSAGDHALLQVACSLVIAGAGLGDSIAVNGCCLTVASLTDDGFQADLMAETMEATALGALREGARVNLERAMPVDGRLGGHLVQGHVDGVGEVVARTQEPGTTWLDIAHPDPLARYLVSKGSVTVQGASLTVHGLGRANGRPTFRVALIPHTLEVTIFDDLGVGDPVNIEVDVIAKYVERLLAAGSDTPYPADPSRKDQSDG